MICHSFFFFFLLHFSHYYYILNNIHSLPLINISRERTNFDAWGYWRFYSCYYRGRAYSSTNAWKLDFLPWNWCRNHVLSIKVVRKHFFRHKVRHIWVKKKLLLFTLQMNDIYWKRRTLTVAFQRMFGILEQWNNNQVTPSLSKPHELSYRSNMMIKNKI